MDSIPDEKWIKMRIDGLSWSSNFCNHDLFFINALPNFNFFIEEGKIPSLNG